MDEMKYLQSNIEENIKISYIAMIPKLLTHKEKKIISSEFMRHSSTIN